jgi:hypothetical protein
MSEDAAGKLRRIRECAFDEDITHILDNLRKWFEDDAADALAECLQDIRGILLERPHVHYFGDAKKGNPCV